MIIQHLKSTISLLVVALNLLTCFAVLLPIVLVQILLPLKPISRLTTHLIRLIYHWAVAVDSFWMQRVMGIELVVIGEAIDDPAPVVICNHQSWFDIPLVQEVMLRQGLITRFLIKREIAWVPIIGWICLAMNFPRLRRSQTGASRQHDYSIIEKASQDHSDSLGALLIFPEGTRFTQEKKARQGASFDYLLKPKSGGLRIIKQNSDQATSLIDVTINYHQLGVKIWNCLHGNPRKITITLEYFKLSEIDDIELWLNNRWQQKDALLAV